MQIGPAFYELKNKLSSLYDEREAAAIAHEVLYFVTGLDKTARLMRKDTSFTDQQQAQYDLAADQLLTGRPLQYVTHSAWFTNKEFYVDEAVLIPRPETEELVQWILDEIPNSKIPNPGILDIGTGSGCIPISLQLALGCDATACDISEAALAVASKNATALGAAVNFVQLDFLDPAEHTKLGHYDVIVSNPPYIPLRDSATMHSNVKDHEPHIALFVPDDDALLFYRMIALFGKEHLKTSGYIYCELDSNHAQQCRELFETMGYTAEIKQDMHGNWRMLRATR
jgi:release factor glutamine methyltransferase